MTVSNDNSKHEFSKVGGKTRKDFKHAILINLKLQLRNRCFHYTLCSSPQRSRTSHNSSQELQEVEAR
jgi:hypothetical protein